MKAKHIKIISALLCIAVVFTAIALTRTELHGASSNTVLFYNDRAWTKSTRLPAEQVHSVYYVPISFLVQLPNVDVRMNEALKTFIITNGDLYLSFDITTDFAANQDKERTYIKTAEYHDERYVPVRTVCAYLNLGYEEIVNSVTGAVAIRVTDGNQQSSLEDLLKLKYASLFPPTPSTDSGGKDTVDSSSPPDSDPSPILSDRTVYITVDGSFGAYTSDILSVLNRYGYKATFFVSSDDIGANAALLSKISAGGHELAVCIKNSSAEENKEDVLAEIREQNELLARLIKKKSRIWRIENGSEELCKAIEEHGYIMWGYDVDVSASSHPSAASSSAINSIRDNDTVTLRFAESKNTAATLRLILEFIKTNDSVCDVRIASSAFYENDID